MKTRRTKRVTKLHCAGALISAWALLASCSTESGTGSAEPGAGEATPEDPRAAEAREFVSRVDGELKQVWIESETAAWENATDITDEHEQAESLTREKAMAYIAQAIKESRAFEDVRADPDTMRQLELLRRATTMPAPDDAAKRKELAETATKLQGMYGKGKHKGKTLGELSDTMSDSRKYNELLEAWKGWRTVSPPMRPMYQRFVELSNEGAREIGYADTGELWRSQYDMPPEEFEAEMERLWKQVEPLYEQLHCHVRARLAEKYGKKKVPLDQPIPAHLLGNMWAQEWGNVYPLMEPHEGQPSIDVTKALQKEGYDSKKMVETAEGFFVSLGMDPLPKTFWERSMLDKPEGREVVCHASAWDPSYDDDLRIKMCIKINMEDLVTIHHELGHNYYYHYYHDLPVLYQQGAHDGFHEGIGDTLALSVTPQYLNKLGLLEEVSEDPKAVINTQMQDGLDKIAFLPFGLLIDRWRWGVFSGEIKPENYNQAWWDLREKYQGVRAPVERSEEDFDPGAKYHIPANTPYSRYFLARILQFQFHKALCEASGHEGPLHQCSIYDSKEAGAKMTAMLAMGSSKPWPDAMEAIAGTRQMDGSAMIEYFEPLMGYLKEQNEGRTCGW
jgi:peptidyl-dipeptidase A